MALHTDRTFNNFVNHNETWSRNRSEEFQDNLSVAATLGPVCKEFVSVYRGFMNPACVEIVPVPQGEGHAPETHTQEWHAKLQNDWRAAVDAAWSDPQYQSADERRAWGSIKHYTEIAEHNPEA